MIWVSIPFLSKNISSDIPFSSTLFKNKFFLIFPSLMDWDGVGGGELGEGEGWVYKHSPASPMRSKKIMTTIINS